MLNPASRGLTAMPMMGEEFSKAENNARDARIVFEIGSNIFPGTPEERYSAREAPCMSMRLH